MTWFKHTLEQLESITSKKTSSITLIFAVDEEEKLPDEVWRDLDEVLCKDKLKSLKGVGVRCVYRKAKYQWLTSRHFEHWRLHNLLSKACKKGIYIA